MCPGEMGHGDMGNGEMGNGHVDPHHLLCHFYASTVTIKRCSKGSIPIVLSDF